MNRREALSRVALIIGGTVIGADLFLIGCSSNHPEAVKFALNSDQMNFLNEVAEIILPETPGSAGAKAANVGLFMQSMVRDCYTLADQKIFLNGLTELNDLAKKKYSKDYLACSAKEKQEILISLDINLTEYHKQSDLLKQQEAEKDKASQASGKPNYLRKTLPMPYYGMIKQLTLLGYFTSEPGYKSQGYVPVPGHYDGELRKGTKG